MDQQLLLTLQEKAAAIVKETNQKVVRFPKNAIEVYYGLSFEKLSQYEFDADALNNQKSGDSNARKFNKMKDEYIAKARYASEPLKKQAAEIGKIIDEGSEKIRKLYEDALAKA